MEFFNWTASGRQSSQTALHLERAHARARYKITFYCCPILKKALDRFSGQFATVNLRISALGRFSQLCVRRIELGDVSGIDRGSVGGELWGTAIVAFSRARQIAGFLQGRLLPLNYDGVFRSSVPCFGRRGDPYDGTRSHVRDFLQEPKIRGSEYP